MSRLQKIKTQVEYLLKISPKDRDDDCVLIADIYERYYGIGEDVGFLDVMRNRKAYGVPSFETIGRCRRKVQEENPRLRGSKAKQKERQIAFDEFYDFAKGRM